MLVFVFEEGAYFFAESIHLVNSSRLSIESEDVLCARWSNKCFALIDSFEQFVNVFLDIHWIGQSGLVVYCFELKSVVYVDFPEF